MTPRGKPFVKGDARINRKGRPKKGESISDRFEDMLNEVLDEATGYTVLDSMMDAAKTKALKGDMGALEYVLARAYGKMVERVESTNRNINQNYDVSSIPLEERKRLLEVAKSAKRTPIRTN